MNPKRDKTKPNADEFHSVAFESQALSTVSLMLQSSEDEVILKAFGAFLKHIEKSDKNKLEAQSVGILKLLLPHLKHSNRSIVKYACMNCGLLASVADIRTEMRKLDIIAVLLDMLKPENETIVHEYVTLALAFMSVDYHGRNYIMKLNGIPVISRMLSVIDPDVQKNSAEIIANMCQDAKAVKILEELGIIPHLFTLLKSEFDVIQQLAFTCLVRATCKRRRQSHFVECGGLDILLTWLENKQRTDFHADILRILINCLDDPECEQYLFDNGFLFMVFEILRKVDKAEIKLLAIKTLFKFSKNSKVVKLMQKDFDVEIMLVGLLTNDIPAIQAAATEIIALVAKHSYWRESFYKAGAIEQLVKLLFSPDPFVRLAATIALANMTYTSSKNSKEVRHYGGLEMLNKFMHENNFELQAATTACLTNMAIDRSSREDAIQMNVMSGFINCFQSRDLIVQLNTCTAIAAYICDSEARNQLLNLGIEPLVNLLSLSKPEIYLKALWIISTIGVYLDVAVAMCEHGIVRLLSQHVKWNHRGNYADLVMERIFLTHLPAKYGYTGRLTATDHIYDLFYDVGSWPWENKFNSLEEFSIAPINSKPPILLVNFNQQASQFILEDTSTENSSASTLGKLPTSNTFRATKDATLIAYLEEVKSNILPLSSIYLQAVALAGFVSDKTGGKLNADDITTMSNELEISRLKCQYTSNVLPVGSFKTTLFRGRALLFKALADQIGIPCSLIRGNLRHVWNEILLPSAIYMERGTPKTETAIVDLIFSPGRLLKTGSMDANEYCDL